eukprot:7251403-Ditylum_brightwellii.AAC.1
MERNRKGTRIVECSRILCVQQDGDGHYFPIHNDDEYNEYIIDNTTTTSNINSSINIKSQRHEIFARWLVDIYGETFLSQGSGVLDVAGGNGMISQTLHDMGVPSTLLDPKPRCSNPAPFGVLPYALNGDGSDLTDRDDDDDDVCDIVRNCSMICGLHPDQATEPIVTLALRLNVPFAILPCCVMPSLFPNRIQKRHGDPVRSYSAFCQYLLDMAPEERKFEVAHLPFVGRNK